MFPRWISDNKDNYEYILKRNSSYSNCETLWDCSYQCSTVRGDKGLVKLYKDFRLERIKQGRSEIEICLRAMEWTFENLLHEEQSEYEGPFNAINILKHCKKTKTTVNCLCHATVLMEVLLALGFKARKISCMPIDVVPFDNHVVTTVFVPCLGKWIMLDPSMCCYVTDAQHNILSVQEIRRCLVDSEKIYVETYSRFSKFQNAGNKRLFFDADVYITYLYKNMFRFLSRKKQSSEYTKENDIFFMLVPKGYLPGNTVQRMFVEGANVELHIVDNEDMFWENE